MPKKGKEKPAIHRQRRWTSSCCALRSIRVPFVLISNGFMNANRVSVSFWIGDWLGRVEKKPKFNIFFKWRRKFVAVRLVLAKQICTDFTWGFSMNSSPFIYDTSNVFFTRYWFHTWLRFAGSGVATSVRIDSEKKWISWKRNCMLIVVSFAIAFYSQCSIEPLHVSSDIWSFICSREQLTAAQREQLHLPPSFSN